MTQNHYDTYNRYMEHVLPFKTDQFGLQCQSGERENQEGKKAPWLLTTGQVPLFFFFFFPLLLKSYNFPSVSSMCVRRKFTLSSVGRNSSCSPSKYFLIHPPSSFFFFFFSLSPLSFFWRFRDKKFIRFRWSKVFSPSTFSIKF